MSLDIYRTIARNLRRARLARDWKQAELGEALSRITDRPWSVATVSAAERSAETDRVRRFDAGDLAAFAQVFGLPVEYFITDPEAAPARAEAAGERVRVPEVERLAGQRVREFRQAAGLRQDQLAERVGGIHPSAIAKSELGIRTVRLADAVAFAAALRQPLCALVSEHLAGSECGHNPQTCLSVERERDYLRTEVDRLRALLDSPSRKEEPRC